MKESRSALFVAQRPSDFVEMKRAIECFSTRGYSCELLYVISGQDERVITEINQLKSTGKLIKIHLRRSDYLEIDVKVVTAELMAFPNDLPKQTVTVKQRKQKIKKNKSKKRCFSWLSAFVKFIKLEKFFEKMFFALENYFVAIIENFKHCIHNYKIKIKRCIRNKILYYLDLLITTAYIIRKYLLYYKQYKFFVTQNKPTILILPEDIVGLVTPLLVKAARCNKIPSLVLPYTIANQQEAFQSLKYYDHFNLKHMGNKIIGFLFPRWVYRDEGISLLRLPVPHIFGHKLLRVTPPDPWMMNSGYTNVVAVENKRMYEYYRHSGLRASKLKIVGALYDDTLSRYSKSKINGRKIIYNILNLTPGKPLFLIGGCPNQLATKIPHCDFNTMDQLAEFIGQQLMPLRTRYNLVVRPHPNYLAFAKQLERYGIVSTILPTDQLLAISDIYLAFASATLRWAIALGIPSLNYDAFYYDYDDFKQVAGILTVKTQAEFLIALARLTEEKTYCALQAALDAEKHAWGNLDGNSADRILNLVNVLCTNKKIRKINYT